MTDQSSPSEGAVPPPGPMPEPSLSDFERFRRAQFLFAQKLYREAAVELETLLGTSDPGHGLSEVRLTLARAYFHSAQLSRAEGLAHFGLDDGRPTLFVFGGSLGAQRLNEAFSAAAVALTRKLDLDPSRVNVNGGAIAVGHPIGMSGNRLALTLAHELRRRGGGYGAAALCGGGGQGDALIIKV